MHTYYVEVYALPYPNKGMRYRTHKGSYNLDSLSPGLYTLLKVKAFDSRDAISKCLYDKGERVI